MAGKLATFVHVRDETGANHVFGPGSDVPAWAAKAITNPDAWEEAPEVEEIVAEEPPRGGAGSAADEWRRYAVDVLKLDVPEDATRDDIVALVDESKKR